MKLPVVVIGGGAAGFFAAIQVARQCDHPVMILEKTGKLLSKVRISGGGRCNVTHRHYPPREFVTRYPRGSRELIQVFSRFDAADTAEWFRQEGVRLKTEPDGRMFPVTDDSMTIVNCLMDLAKKHHVTIHTGAGVSAIHATGDHLSVETGTGTLLCHSVIVAAGGSSKPEGYDWLKPTGHGIDLPVPSLFTFNLPGEPVRNLQGVAVKNVTVKTSSDKQVMQGPLLITHWGLSGPAVLKLSAFCAEALHRDQYRCTVTVNWTGDHSHEDIKQQLKTLRQEQPRALPRNTPVMEIPRRLWEFLCDAAGIDNGRPWAEQPMRLTEKLGQLMHASAYQMSGKTTFKEEFVTCGGVKLKEVDFRTMESKLVPGLYFCGEVLNIDGITGGFNFQAAWSTAWCAAEAVVSRIRQAR